MSNQKLEKEYDEANVPFITAEQLKSKLHSNEPLMIFDIGDISSISILTIKVSLSIKIW
jgi:hypothetical protein